MFRRTFAVSTKCTLPAGNANAQGAVSDLGALSLIQLCGTGPYRKELPLVWSTEMKGESSNDSGKIPEIH